MEYLREASFFLHDIYWKNRDVLTKKYSWAIPNSEAISFIKNLNKKLIEICAGNGYWAMLLKRAGVDIIPFDRRPPHLFNNPYSNGKYTNVKIGDPRKILKYPKRTLFLCWPPYDEGLVVDECLKYYKGKYIIYIGERGGCTSWSDQLERWHLVDRVDIPQWRGIHDNLYLLERN